MEAKKQQEKRTGYAAILKSKAAGPVQAKPKPQGFAAVLKSEAFKSK
jgi:hypothetical protein